MEKTIRAKSKKGIIEPLEKLELEEETEISITIKEVPKEDRFEKSMGGWKGLVDCEQLIKDIYKSRRLSAKRPEVRL
ncbi:MAG: DUF104 domain-containing protein [archaeon]|nr:DUF104 domain-containing protein [archaeon]